MSAQPETEAAGKRELALEAARGAGAEALVLGSPANVRWLLCGRGRPVDITAPESPYRLVIAPGAAYLLHPDIEGPRVHDEERVDELGYEPVSFPWPEGPADTVSRLLGGHLAAVEREVEPALAPLRRHLGEPELNRYRSLGRDVAEAMSEALPALAPRMTEMAAAGLLAGGARTRGINPAVVLVGGEERQAAYRHPIPTSTRLGRHAVLVLSAEREGLWASITRLVSFGPPPERLADLTRLAAEVDALVLAASQPGASLGELFDLLDEAYRERGFPGEWRHHHQGGLTGYASRTALAEPGSDVRLPPACAVAWNPSITGGAKSEDTALVTEAGLEVVTPTPRLPLLPPAVPGPPRPAIVEL